MNTPPAGIPEADWSSCPAGARQLILAQQEEIQSLRRENDDLRHQLNALATELASLREWTGRSSRNSSKPPSSDGPGFQPQERRKGRGRERGGQPGHRGSASAAADRAECLSPELQQDPSIAQCQDYR